MRIDILALLGAAATAPHRTAAQRVTGGLRVVVMPHTREEFVAQAELAKARRQLGVHMRGGARRLFGRSGQLATLKLLLTRGQSVKASASKLAKRGSMAGNVAPLPGMKVALENCMVGCRNVNNIHHVIAAIGGEVMHERVSARSGGITGSVPLFSDGYNPEMHRRWIQNRQGSGMKRQIVRKSIVAIGSSVKQARSLKNPGIFVCHRRLR